MVEPSGGPRVCWPSTQLLELEPVTFRYRPDLVRGASGREVGLLDELQRQHDARDADRRELANVRARVRDLEAARIESVCGGRARP